MVVSSPVLAVVLPSPVSVFELVFGAVVDAVSVAPSVAVTAVVASVGEVVACVAEFEAEPASLSPAVPDAVGLSVP
jgi:hypothetical protein